MSLGGDFRASGIGWLRRHIPWRLPIGGVARSMGAVGIAAAVGQGAMVVAAPLLSRLYSPADFGVLATYSAILGVLLAAVSLSYDRAIPIADDLAEAAHLLVLSAVLAACLSTILAMILLGSVLLAGAGGLALAPFYWLLPAGLFVGGLAQALGGWAVFTRAFTRLSRMRVAQGLGQAGAQIGLGLLGSGAVGLVLGEIAGRTLGIEQILGPLRAGLKQTRITLAGIVSAARDKWSFARIMTGANVMNSLSLQVPLLLIPMLFDLDASGQYFMAYRVLVLPASFIAASFSQVFYGEASARRHQPDALHRLARSAAGSLVAVSIPTYTVVAIGGPALFASLLGEQWAEAGQFARIMAPWLLVWSVASPMSSLLLVGRRERESLAFTALELSLRAISLLVGAYYQSLTLAVATLSAVSMVLMLAALWRILRVAHVRVIELIGPAVRSLASTAVVLMAVAGLATVVGLGAVLAAALAWIGAVLLSARTSPDFRHLLSGKAERAG